MNFLNLTGLMRTLALALLASTTIAASAGPVLPDGRVSAASTAHAAVGAYLELWANDGRADEASLFSENMVLRYEHTNPELRSELRGRSPAIRQIRAVARGAGQWKFRDLRVFPTLRDNVYFAQYTATGTSAADGAVSEQNVVLAIELDGQQVVRIVEFANPAMVMVRNASSGLTAPH
jgi:ketosteroid isomerase-like protein